jgi:hypothetical protein
MICIPDATPLGFRRWRRDLRNRVDYLRRRSPHWRDFGLHVWRSRDGKLRGIVSLATLGSAEAQDGFSRWPTTLRAISSDDLRLEIYHVVKPSVISLEGVGRGRYWARTASVFPRRELSISSGTGLDWEHSEPMPILL